jgi:hypothetical protein
MAEAKINRGEFGRLSMALVLTACAGSSARRPIESGTANRRDPMELVPLGTMVITMGTSVFMDGVPAGTRLVIDFTDVTVEGDRLRARKAAGSPAGDWLILGPHDVATLDIRMLLQTHDGASILVHGLGRTDSAKFSTGAPCYFAPLFETNDPRYAWLNSVQGIARGTAAGKIVTFELAMAT